jgi:hypothetical protein
MSSIVEISIIEFRYNWYSGFTFEILNLEFERFDGALFGINIRKDYFSFDILFFNFQISKPF